MKKLVWIFVLVSAMAIQTFAGAGDYVRKVQMMSPGGDVITTGSAVLISPKEGIYVTAWHVVADGSDRGRLMLDGKKEVELIATSQADDVLFFRSDAVDLAELDLRGSTADEKVRAFGFVQISDTNPMIIKTERKGAYQGAAILKGAIQTNRADMFSAQVDHGMSGGGIFAGTALVGVITNMSRKTEKRSFACSAARIANMLAIIRAARLADQASTFGQLPELSKVKV